MRKAQTEMAHPERKTRYLPTCGRGQATDLGEEEVEAGLDVGHHRRVALWLPVDIRDLLLGDGLDDLAEDGPVAHLRLEVVDASPTLRFLCHSRRRRRVNNLMFRDKKWQFWLVPVGWSVCGCVEYLWCSGIENNGGAKHKKTTLQCKCLQFKRWGGEGRLLKFQLFIFSVLLC